ncbi:hypothetical protein Tco_0109087 [Tanacetum coccineum]
MKDLHVSKMDQHQEDGQLVRAPDGTPWFSHARSILSLHAKALSCNAPVLDNLHHHEKGEQRLWRRHHQEFLTTSQLQGDDVTSITDEAVYLGDHVDGLGSDAESVDMPHVSYFLDSDDESDDGEVINDIYVNMEYCNHDRHTGSYYPKRYWELLPKEILGAITQRDIGSYYPKRYWELLPKERLDVLWENGAWRRVLWLLPWNPWFLNTPWDFYTSASARIEKSFEVGRVFGMNESVEGDGEVRVMTRGFGDFVAKLGDNVVMEVLVRYWTDGDVVPTSVPVVHNMVNSCYEGMDIAKITRIVKNRTNTDTGTDRVYKSRENAFKVNQSQPLVNIGQLPGDKTFQNSQNALNVKSKFIKMS